MGALTLQSESIYKEPFYPLIPDVGYLPWNSIDALRRITEDTAGVIYSHKAISKVLNTKDRLKTAAAKSKVYRLG